MRIADEDFALWAFGDVWYSYLAYDRGSLDLMNAWNERHGNLLLLHEDAVIGDSMNKMKEIYETNNMPHSRTLERSPTISWNEKTGQRLSESV